MADDEDGLMDESGKRLKDMNPSDPPWRELRTRKGWARKKAEQDAKKEEKELEGTKGRSIGEHVLAAGRAVFEGEKYREREEMSGSRDPVSPLYDRRKVKPKYEEDEEKPRKRPLYDKER